MRKLFIAVMLVLMSLVALAQWDNVIGADWIAYGWTIKDEAGNITGAQGISWTLGYAVKYYFDPLKVEDFNLYWGWGVDLLALGVHLTIGGDYVMENGLYIGGGLGVLSSFAWAFIPVPVPAVTVGYYF